MSIASRSIWVVIVMGLTVSGCTSLRKTTFKDYPNFKNTASKYDIKSKVSFKKEQRFRIVDVAANDSFNIYVNPEITDDAGGLFIQWKGHQVLIINERENLRWGAYGKIKEISSENTAMSLYPIRFTLIDSSGTFGHITWHLPSVMKPGYNRVDLIFYDMAFQVDQMSGSKFELAIKEKDRLIAFIELKNGFMKREGQAYLGADLSKLMKSQLLTLLILIDKIAEKIWGS